MARTIDLAVVKASVRKWLSLVNEGRDKTIDLETLRSFIEFTKKDKALKLLNSIAKEGEDWIQVENKERGVYDYFLTPNAAKQFLMASHKPLAQVVRQVFIEEQNTLEGLRKQVRSGELVMENVRTGEVLDASAVAQAEGFPPATPEPEGPLSPPGDGAVFSDDDAARVSNDTATAIRAHHEGKAAVLRAQTRLVETEGSVKVGIIKAEEEKGARLLRIEYEGKEAVVRAEEAVVRAREGLTRAETALVEAQQQEPVLRAKEALTRAETALVEAQNKEAVLRAKEAVVRAKQDLAQTEIERMHAETALLEAKEKIGTAQEVTELRGRRRIRAASCDVEAPAARRARGGNKYVNLGDRDLNEYERGIFEKSVFYNALLSVVPNGAFERVPAPGFVGFPGYEKVYQTEVNGKILLNKEKKNLAQWFLDKTRRLFTNRGMILSDDLYRPVYRVTVDNAAQYGVEPRNLVSWWRSFLTYEDKVNGLGGNRDHE